MKIRALKPFVTHVDGQPVAPAVDGVIEVPDERGASLVEAGLASEVVEPAAEPKRRTKAYPAEPAR